MRQGAVPEVELIRDAEFAASRRLMEPSPSSDWMPKLRLLWEKRRTLYKVAAWAIVMSTVLALLIANRYDSTASIMPPDTSSGAGAMMTAVLASKASPELASLASGFLGMKGTGALFAALLRSRTVEDHIVDRFNLQSVYWVPYKQDARKILEQRTKINEDRKSGIITITVTDLTRNRARDIAQAYVQELNQLLSTVSTSSARRERMFIEQRLSAVKTDLDAAERKFSTFASKNTALDIKEQTKAMVESAAILQGQLIAAQSELEGLTQVYTPSNVRVRSARARVEELQRQLEKVEGTDASLASETLGPQSGEVPSIRKLPLLGVEWADLYRQSKIQETVYELLNQQYEMARIQEAKEIPTVNVVDPANLPERKSWPPRLLIIVGLTMLSLATAAMVLITQKKLESMERDDPRRQLVNTAAQALAHFKRYRLFRRSHQSASSGNGSAA